MIPDRNSEFGIARGARRERRIGQNNLTLLAWFDQQ